MLYVAYLSLHIVCVHYVWYYVCLSVYELNTCVHLQHEADSALRKARLLQAQRQEEYEKAKVSTSRLEEEQFGGGGGAAAPKQLEKRRRLEEEALQKVQQLLRFNVADCRLLWEKWEPKYYTHTPVLLYFVLSVSNKCQQRDRKGWEGIRRILGQTPTFMPLPHSRLPRPQRQSQLDYSNCILSIKLKLARPECK